MRMLLIRSLPWLCALVALLASQYQWTHPFLYPAPLLIWLGFFLVSMLLIRWRKVSLRASFEKLTPAVLTAVTAIFAFLMAQDSVQRLGLTLTLVALSWVVLELFFYYAYDPKRYPVNALSHVNLALAPLIVFYATCGLGGVQLFLQTPWWLTLGLFLILGVLLFSLTEHPVADPVHRIRWRFLGMWLGVQVSLLVIFLPVSVSVRGALIALLFFIPLRIRRYTYAPHPPKQFAWIEGSAACVFFLSLLLISQWA